MTMTTATRRQPEALPLWPDELDVELPFDEAAEQLAEAQASDLVRDTLVDALAQVLDALEGGPAIPAPRLRHYRTLVGRPAVVDEASTPEARRDEGIARAAARWTEEESALVDTAIRQLAERLVVEDGLGIAPREFTTADVWRELDGRVPVTKGIAGRMAAAASAGVIANTGRTVIAPRESTGPNHGQRLTVWRAL